MPVQTRSLTDLFAELDQYAQRVPLGELTRLLDETEITFDDVRQFAHFGRQSYQRNLMHEGRGYQALVLCWRPGQRSPIHDHRGSSCGVKVIRGTATETRFDRTPHGHVFATDTRRLEQGSVCGSQDDDLHQVSNLEPPGCDLITLHIYSPPLLIMGLYSLTDTHVTEFRDPVIGLLEGDGI